MGIRGIVYLFFAIANFSVWANSHRNSVPEPHFRPIAPASESLAKLFNDSSNSAPFERSSRSRGSNFPSGIPGEPGRRGLPGTREPFGTEPISRRNPNRPFDEAKAPEGFRPSSTKGLIPANFNGNPGFSYSVTIDATHSGSCQASLIHAENGMCFAATAAHCFEDVYKNSPTRSTDPQTGALTCRANVQTADFGSVQATVFLSREYIFNRPSSKDTAAFMFPCKGPGEVPVLVIYNSQLQQGQQVTYGKVMNGKAGKYNGQVYREPKVVGINGLPVGTAQESIMQPSNFVIEQGDSGGPLIVEENGQLFLAGVLSTSDDVKRRWPIGNYATGISMDFFRRVLRAHARSREI